MQARLVPLAALTACLLMLAGCRDRHEPTKPTVAAAQLSTPAPLS